MDDITTTVTWFAEPGPQNTAATLAAALRRARTLGLSHVVVASDTGKTAKDVLAAFGPEFRVVVVTNAPNLALPVAKLHDYLPRFADHKRALAAAGTRKIPASLSEAQVAELRAMGAAVLRMDWSKITAFAHADFRSLERIGVAVRVAVCITVTAHIDGALPTGQDVLALAGTGFGGGGADTALVMRPAAAWRDWRVLETIARPRVGPPSE